MDDELRDGTASGKRKESEEHDEQASNLKARKKARSWVWNHSTKKKDNYNKCNCHYYGKELACATTSGTSSLKKHLECCKQHKVWLHANRDKSQTVLKNDVDGSNLRLGKISQKEFRDATNEMLVLVELPLSFVECLAWRQFCNRVQLYRPHSRRTATRDIIELYVRKKASIRKILGDNKQRVSLTTDIWVAPNTSSSYIVITAHFIDASWCLRKIIIGFKNISDHKGETICNCLLECLAEWNIKKIFCITVDNATANSSEIRKFKENFKQIGDNAFVLSDEFLHLRCATHILNLGVKEGLQEVDNSVNAIRNGIQFVRSSTNRLKSFELRVEIGKISRGSIPLDVRTRWNSTYLMLNTALKFRVVFEKMEQEDKLYGDYFLENVEGKKRVGPPTYDDWTSVESLLKVLVLFYNSTIVLSSSTHSASYKCYNEIVRVVRNLNCYNKGSNEALKTKSSAMLGKLDKYWNPFGEMKKLLIVASVFDPSKMKFAQFCFEKLYGKDSIEDVHLNNSVMDILKRLFDEYNSFVSDNGCGVGVGVSVESSFQSSQSQTQSQDQFDSLDRMVVDNDLGYESMDRLYNELVEEIGFQDPCSELELYLNENVENPNLMKGADYDVLSWWKRNSLKFPVLSLVAKDVLAMQVSSVASKSAFSTSGRILEPSRSCLRHFMIEVLMCTEQWLKCEIKINEKGLITIQQMLSYVELQDKLMREFENSFNLHGE